jgi:SAM-dependent methyltransferase
VLSADEVDNSMTDRHAAARELVRAYHLEEREPTAEELDGTLGLGPAEPARTDEEVLTEAFPSLPTPYPICRGFFCRTAPTAEDLVVDLGCGSGRLVLYGALLTPARLWGIELDRGRFEVACRAVEQLGLSNVTILRGDILEQDWSDGTIFYAFRPLPAETEPVVVERLHEIGRRRAITIGAYRMLPNLFDPAVFEGTGRGYLRIYRSRIR